MANPFDVVRMFESALCEYTGARYAVTTTSCTQALLLALACRYWMHGDRGTISMPKRSYVGVPASIKAAGFHPEFRDEEWQGEYELRLQHMPTRLKVWDSARRFTSAMYRPGAMQCVSFHWGKILGLSQGGAVLHDSEQSDAWLRRARFDGRTEGIEPKCDQVQYPSWHAYMSPEVAAHGLVKLRLLRRDNPPLPWDDYPDLSQLEVFK